MLDPYPLVYRFIFGLLEPAGLFGGAAFAILAPNQFHHAYLGSGWLGDTSRGSNTGQKGVLVAAGMGTCELYRCTITALGRLTSAFNRHAYHRLDVDCDASYFPTYSQEPAEAA